MASPLALETATPELVPPALPVHEAAEAFTRDVEFRMRAYSEDEDEACRGLTLNVDAEEFAVLPADKVTMPQRPCGSAYTAMPRNGVGARLARGLRGLCGL